MEIGLIPNIDDLSPDGAINLKLDPLVGRLPRAHFFGFGHGYCKVGFTDTYLRVWGI